MGLYRYEAISDRGKRVSGAIDADSLHDAKLKLIRRQIVAVRVDPLAEAAVSVHLKGKDLLGLTREMARLLHAGLPLFETLSALEEKYRGQKAHQLLLDLADRVRSGLSFSKSLERHPHTFDLLYQAMVANAEKTGRLAQALDEIALLLARRGKIGKQIMAALLYPSLLSLFCCVVLSSLLFFVIPSLQELFEGRDLHPFTRIVFACSHFACAAKGPLIGFAATFLAGVAYLAFTKKGRAKSLSYLAKLPGIRTLFAKIALVRFCRASATLLEGGIPLIPAFAEARAVMGHPELEQLIAQAEARLAQGEPLHVPFQNHPLIPPLVPRMIAIAQQGGKLPFMMQQIAEIYEEELEAMLAHIAAVAQPLLLLILGGLVGFVLLSVLLPLTDVSSFVT